MIETAIYELAKALAKANHEGEQFGNDDAVTEIYVNIASVAIDFLRQASYDVVEKGKVTP